MSKNNIYSDIRGYILTTEGGSIEVHIIDGNGSKYNPNLILPNLLAVKALRNYLNKILKEKNK